MQIDLRLLTYFCRTAELGGISRAASALNIAQPTLSKAIQLLEHQLGVPLFTRGPQGVTPTLFGERLLRHARLVTAQVNAAASEIESLRTGKAGEVRIGAGPSWLRRVLPLAVAQALAERPDVRITVTGGFDETLLGGLDDGSLDVVVAEVPLEGDHPDYAVEVLTRDRLVVCCRVGHPLTAVAAPGLAPSLADVLAQPWALPPPHTQARRKLDGRLRSLGLPSPRAVTVSTSLAFILSLVNCSDALTYTTFSALATPDGQGLVALDVPAIAAEREAGLIFRRLQVITPATEHVVGHLRALARLEQAN
jgi:DNA-binding transcriptional LysR family regulator